MARHQGFRGGDYNTYHGDPYTLDEIIWDATGRAGVHLVTKTKYGQEVEFPTIPDKNDTSELMLIVSEYVESIKTPPLIVRCSGIGGSISPLGNNKYSVALSTGATKCPTSIKDHVPKKYHAEDNTIIPHVGGPYVMNAEDLSPAERSLIANTIINQMQGYYRTGVIGTDPVIGAFPNGPMSISKRTPEAKQSHFREPAVQDEDGFWNKGPNRWQAHKIAQGVAYDQLEKAREIGALTPGYRHRGRSGRFRRNPFKFGAESEVDLISVAILSDRELGGFGGLAGIIYGELAATGEVIPLMHVSNNSYDFLVNDILPEGAVHHEKGGTDDAMLSKSCALMLDMYDGLYTRCWFEPASQSAVKSIANLGAEDFAAEKKLMCAEHDDYFQACGCTVKNASGASYIGGGSLMDIHKDTGLDAFTPGELTHSSAIHGDFDQASLNYSGKQNLEVRTAEFEAPMIMVDSSLVHDFQFCEFWRTQYSAFQDAVAHINRDVAVEAWELVKDEDGEFHPRYGMKWPDAKKMMAEEFAAVSTASPNLAREKANLRAKIRDEVDPKFEWNQCVWGPYALRMEGASTNKFYIIFVYDNGKGVYRALGGYGGLGQNPRLQDEATTRSRPHAEAAATRKLKAKERKGYFTYNAEENRQPPWSATNPRPNRRIECGECDARGFIAGTECTKCDGAGYWNIHSPRCATCETDIQWTDGAECDECDEWYCDNHLTEDGECKVCGNTSLSFHSEDIPVWNDGIVEWETSGPMSPTGSGYSSASVPPTGVIAGPGDTFLNYTDAQNYLVESSGGLWGAEEVAEFEAMARIDPKKANDVADVKRAIKSRYPGIKISRTEYITNRKGSSNKYHVFAFTNRGIFNGYGRIGKTMTIFGPMSESEGLSKLKRKFRQGYEEQR